MFLALLKIVTLVLFNIKIWQYLLRYICMRKIVVLSFVALDGVMQAPGGPEEDKSSDFAFGGWQAPYADSYMMQEMTKQLSEPFDLLLGRKTYDIFASYWPKHTDGPVGKPFME
jgi:dihydrofolate reductase